MQLHMYGQQHGAKMQLVNKAKKNQKPKQNQKTNNLDLLQIFNVEKKLEKSVTMADKGRDENSKRQFGQAAFSAAELLHGKRIT